MTAKDVEVYSPTIRRKEMSAVLNALVEDKIGPGEQCAALISAARDAAASLTGGAFEYCLTLRSPATALSLALRMLDLAPGEGVLVSALSPAYYLNVLTETGFTPVFCDVDPGTAVINADSARWAIEHAPEVKVKALALHHTLGFMPPMETLAGLGLPIIEDISCAYGTTQAERAAGSFGVLTLLGLEERDMLTAGGGALLYAAGRREAAVLRGQAALPPEYGLPDMNAALAGVQFREYKRNAERRAEIAEMFTRAALRTRHKMLVHSPGLKYNNYAFPIVFESGFKEAEAYAKRKQIAVELAFKGTLAGSGLAGDHCPEAYSLSLRTALFPLYPRLSSEAADRVARLIQTLP